jgi:hypothetical protein
MLKKKAVEFYAHQNGVDLEVASCRFNPSDT